MSPRWWARSPGAPWAPDASGMLNQLWYALGGTQPLFNINSPGGHCLGDGAVRRERGLRDDLRGHEVHGPGARRELTSPRRGQIRDHAAGDPAAGGPCSAWSAPIFVFAEMLGSFSAAAILGMPERFFVVTTAIWTLVIRFPPDFPLAAAMGISLFAIMLAMMYLYGGIMRATTTSPSPAKPFDRASCRWAGYAGPLFAVCVAYLAVAVFLPMLALLYVSFLKFATIIPKDIAWTLENYRTAFNLGPIRAALGTSLIARAHDGDDQACWYGAAIVDHLSFANAGARHPGIHRDVSAVGAAPGVRPGAIAGLGDHAHSDLWHHVAAIAGLSNGVPAPGGTDDFRGDGPAR